MIDRAWFDLAPAADLLALAWLALCWMGYAIYASPRVAGSRSAPARMSEVRLAWALQMLQRDNRMVDLQLTRAIMAQVTFLGQGCLFAFAGAFALIGAREQARAAIAEIPFAAPADPAAYDLKALTLACIFAYAFFKCSWAMRQLTYLSVMVGAAPPPMSEEDAQASKHARRTARIADAAARHINRAQRAFYFGLSVLSWFLHPFLFMAVAAWVVLVLWRREFYSNLKRELGELGTPVG